MVTKLELSSKAIVEGLVIAFFIIFADTFKLYIGNEIWGNVITGAVIVIVIAFIVFTRRE